MKKAFLTFLCVCTVAISTLFATTAKSINTASDAQKVTLTIADIKTEQLPPTLALKPTSDIMGLNAPDDPNLPVNVATVTAKDNQYCAKATGWSNKLGEKFADVKNERKNVIESKVYAGMNTLLSRADTKAEFTKEAPMDIAKAVTTRTDMGTTSS